MSALFFRHLAVFLMAFLVTFSAQNVQADDPTTKGLSAPTRQLFEAINENNLEAARAAITAGANVKAENSLGVRPVDLAVDLGHFDVAHFLLAADQAPEQKQEGIPLPPPVTPLPALSPPPMWAPPVLSGPQFSAPAFKPIPRPAIAAPIFAAPIFTAPKIVAPAPPPVISSAQIPAQPRIAASRIAAPRFAPPAIATPSIPAAPNPSPPIVRAPSTQAVPLPPKLSPVAPPAPAPFASTAIIAPPEPPPLTNDDGTLVRTPEPLRAPDPASAVAATTKAIVAVPKPSGGFMSSAWYSMTDWIPFTGDDEDAKKAPVKPAPLKKGLGKSVPIKQAQPSPPAQVAPPSARTKAPEPSPSTAKNVPAKFENGFFSSAWDSMTGWVPFTGDDKKNPKNSPSPRQRLPLSSEHSSENFPASKFSAPQQVAELSQVASSTSTNQPTSPAEARELKDAEQKALQEKAQIAAQHPKLDKAPTLSSGPGPKKDTQKPPTKKIFFDKIDQFFKADQEKAAEEEDLAKIQTAKIDSTAGSAPSEAPISETSASYANLPLPHPPPAVKAISISHDVKLVVGTSSKLGVKLNADLVEQKKCVAKTEQNILFCLERVPWPAAIKSVLKNPLSLMGDDMAMIRYDGGKASQIHINFPSSAFDKLIVYFEKKYGPPTEYPKILMHRIGAPSVENPTVRWRVANPAMGRDVILEIRKTDDLRSILPAQGDGVTRLYSSGNEMIFRYVSTADIMLMRMKYSTTRRKRRPRRSAEKRNKI